MENPLYRLDGTVFKSYHLKRQTGKYKKLSLDEGIRYFNYLMSVVYRFVE